MRGHSDAKILRWGAITLLLMAVIMAATFNLSKFPGFAGRTYEAEFSDASGIHEGNMVQVAGMRVGRVQDVRLEGAKVVVKFEVDDDVDFGPDSSASIEVLNLLGEKYLELTPAGEGQLAEESRIPLSRTESAYDIVGVFSDLTTTTEDIDKRSLKQAFDVLADTMKTSAPEIRASFDGIARISRTVASRDSQIRSLLRNSKGVSKLLADRSQDIVDLMGHSDLVFAEVRRRREAIHQLLVNARRLAVELRGVATDNRRQIGPALREVDDLISLLNSKEKELKATLDAVGPYVSILSNIIGTGPWFDAYAVNLAAIPTGEFQPGPLED